MNHQPANRPFYCPRWPGCECPDGTVIHDCPGLTDPRNKVARDLGVLHDKAAAEAARQHQALTNAGIAILLAAGIVAVLFVADWPSISDRLYDALGLYPA